jgi:hypothetical protein
MRLAIAIFLLPVLAFGNWATNAWPAYQYPRKGQQHAMDCYSSVVERIAASSYSGSPMVPKWYRFQRTLLVDYKANLRDCLEADYPAIWLDTSLVSGDNYQPFFGTNHYVPGNATNWPHLDAATACAKANLPTNFFDYTPWRCLCGLGPYTNDATVGHPYGWTNEYTAAGGTNYPSGRSAWYTTDYGWQGIKEIAPLMSRILPTEQISGQMETNTGYGYGSTDSGTWDDVETAAEVNYLANLTTNWAGNSYGGTYSRKGYGETEDDKWGEIWRRTTLFTVTFWESWVSHSALIYIHGTTNVHHQFNQYNSSGEVTEDWQQWGSTAYGTSGTLITSNLCGAAITTLPQWVADPAYASPWYDSDGYAVGAWWAVLRFDFEYE